MSVGLGLLHKTLEEGAALSYLDERGVTREWFSGKEELAVYDYVRRHFLEFGSLPEMLTVCRETEVTFPEFSNEPIEYWVKRVEDRKHSALVLGKSQEMVNAIAEGDLDSARNMARDLYMRVALPSLSGKVYDMAAVARDVLIKHDQLQKSAHRVSIPFGLAYLDEISMGAQPGDTVALVGRPSIGKSYFILMMCLNCFAVGRKPLLITLEMPVLQCVRRMIGLRNHVMATMIRIGRLSYYARERLEEDILKLEQDHSPFPILQGALSTTIEDIVLRVQEYRPDALYVDGAYLLRTKGRALPRWERVTETAEWLKMIAHDFSIPVIATYQFNRLAEKKGGGTLGNVAYSDAIPQLASIVIGIRDEEEAEASEVTNRRRFASMGDYKILDLLKGREGERGRLRVLYDMQRMVIEQDAVLQGYMLGDGGDRDQPPREEDR